MDNISTSLVETTSAIQRVVAELENLKGEVKLKKEMLDSEMLSDKAYFEASESFQEAKDKLKAEKTRVMANSELARKLSIELPEMKEEVSEIVIQLAGLLSNYVSLTGSDIIELADGSEMKIKKSFKLGKV